MMDFESDEIDDLDHYFDLGPALVSGVIDNLHPLKPGRTDAPVKNP